MQELLLDKNKRTTCANAVPIGGPEEFICELCELKNANPFFKEFALFPCGGPNATEVLTDLPAFDNLAKGSAAVQQQSMTAKIDAAPVATPIINATEN